MNVLALRKVKKILKKVNALKESVAQLSDEELQAKSP